jgi:hypothetical protein
MVHDLRTLQVTLFGTLQRNLSALDFSSLLPDIMTIADEVDSHLTRAMASFTMSRRRLPRLSYNSPIRFAWVKFTRMRLNDCRQ